MTDTISRQAAIDAVADLYWMDERLLNFKKEIDATFDKIKALPSAQPDPRPKRGKWYDWSFTAFDGCTVWHRACSVCGYKRDDDNLDKDTNYCPNCGARMDEVSEE